MISANAARNLTNYYHEERLRALWDRVEENIDTAARSGHSNVTIQLSTGMLPNDITRLYSTLEEEGYNYNSDHNAEGGSLYIAW